MDNIKLQLTSQHAMLTLSRHTHTGVMSCRMLLHLTPFIYEQWCHKTERSLAPLTANGKSTHLQCTAWCAAEKCSMCLHVSSGNCTWKMK